MRIDLHRLRKVIGQNAEFPDNLADIPDVRPLLAEVRTWPKTDVHTHVSASISPAYFKTFYQGFQDKPAFRKDASKALQTLRGVLPRPRPKCDIDSFLNDPELALCCPYDAQGHYDGYFERGDLADLVAKASIDDFANAVGHVAEQHFQDGVKSVELRLNPKVGSDGPDQVLRRVAQELREVENRYPGCLARMIFCFRRTNMDPVQVEKYVDDLANLRSGEFSDFAWRMLGIDFVGYGAPGLGHVRVEKTMMRYRRALEVAKNAGFLVTAHMGEHWWDVADRAMQDAIVALVHNIRDCVEHSLLDRIGHSMVLDPNLAIQIGRPDLGHEIMQTLSLMRERRITIESCPSVYVCSRKVRNYAKFPVHFWVLYGVPVKLGTDGLWTYRTTMTEEVVKLLLSSPYAMTLDEARKICT